jgi:hypothetical protein
VRAVERGDEDVEVAVAVVVDDAGLGALGRRRERPGRNEREAGERGYGKEERGHQEQSTGDHGGISEWGKAGGRAPPRRPKA